MFDPKKCTPFTDIYEKFFAKVTDDYFMEITQEETKAACQDLLLSSLYSFEFPRFPLDDYVLNEKQEDSEETISYFPHLLNDEEKNILATYMVVAWLGQQLATVELVRMKYSGADFKFTSQANHLQKLNQLRNQYTQQGFHLQRLYKRRVKDQNGVYHSSLSKIVEPEDAKPRDTSLYPNPNKE